jgi:hypothetical protein
MAEETPIAELTLTVMVLPQLSPHPNPSPVPPSHEARLQIGQRHSTVLPEVDNKRDQDAEDRNRIAEMLHSSSVPEAVQDGGGEP